MVANHADTRCIARGADNLSQRPFLTGIGLVVLALLTIFPMITIAGSGITLCTSPTNICNDQIKFITSVSGNDTSLITNKVTTGSWSAIQNQTMIVVPSIGATLVGPNQVVSVTDLLGDTFTRQVVQQYFTPFAGDYNEVEIWSGIVSISTTNTVTATWNTTGNPLILQTAIYSGIIGIGSHNSTVVGNGAFASPITITTLNSGSWIFGVADSVNPTSCNAISSSPSFITRSDVCTFVPTVFEGETQISDNATSLRNLFKLTYAPTNVAQGPLVAVELVSLDKEPKTPDFSTFCTISPFNCPTVLNAVSLNTNPSALNKGLTQGTAFCTGITTKPLTTVGNKIFVWAAYSADDLNTTNAKIFLQLYVSTNAPTTTFGSGLCATGGSIVATGSIFFNLNGALSLTNTFSTALNGVDTIVGGNPAGGTYYGWLEVTAQNVPVGSLGMDQLCSNVSFGLCSLQMMEIK